MADLYVPPGSEDCPAAGTCQASAGPLLCMLDDEHEGLHYDDIDGISWTEGRTDA